MDDREDTWHHAADLIIERFEDDLVALVLASGELHHLDRSATLVFDAADDQTTPSVIESVARVVGLSTDTVDVDVRSTLDALEVAKVLARRPCDVCRP